MIGSLQTWQWAATDDAAPLLASLRPGASVATLAGLRARWSPEQIAVATEIVHARSKAGIKFGARAERLIADSDGLQMASSIRSARHKAARFRAALGDGATVLDACCGIGGDTMALSDAGLHVTALDLHECRAWMAGTNARCHWVAGDFLSHPIEVLGIHIDPARRAGDTRSRDPEAFQPPLSEIVRRLEGCRLSAVKLNPGVKPEILPSGELEIISESGSLMQAVLWSVPAGHGSRRATLLAGDGSTHTISADPDRPDDSTPIGDYIHTMDPALERADLVGALLRTLDAGIVFPGTGLLTASRPIRSAWLTPFRVLDVLPWNRRSVRARLRCLRAGIVTVKTRGGLLDADRLSRELRGDGPADLVLFVLPIDGRLRAIITDRLTNESAPPEPTEASDGAGLGDGS
ncbi:MAG: class I SAM-dependent methyltransferase [Planctomycetota bacterium]|nr:MAG: class I SAM-dependent methyltransferase [Planctomycetota bacterium]